MSLLAGVVEAGERDAAVLLEGAWQVPEASHRHHLDSFRCEVTDVDPAIVEIGMRVEMTFRLVSSVGGVHNYFWKARPIREGGS